MCAGEHTSTPAGWRELKMRGFPWGFGGLELGDLDSNQGCPGQSREFYR
jgi:hypothetical protein